MDKRLGKLAYKLRVSDFIPFLGVMNYFQRNEYTCLDDDSQTLPTVVRGIGLAYMNIGLAGMGVWKAGELLYNGLEKIIN